MRVFSKKIFSKQFHFILCLWVWKVNKRKKFKFMRKKRVRKVPYVCEFSKKDINLKMIYYWFSLVRLRLRIILRIVLAFKYIILDLKKNSFQIFSTSKRKFWKKTCLKFYVFSFFFLYSKNSNFNLFFKFHSPFLFRFKTRKKTKC